jgi:phage-related protein
MRPVSWLNAAWRSFQEFPNDVRRQIAFGLDRAAEGGKADNAKPLHGIDGGVFEISANLRSALTIDPAPIVRSTRSKSARTFG